ncbi:MAG: hypothetical protein J6K92_05405 [Oscillospiraceae bacterium]|nr:hypothetical protein [Oscillospiraceae bacterium]
MSFIAGYLLGLGQGGSKVIKPLTVTENGTYKAPEGVDGYDPVIVDVPDRYDEGYKDAKDLNQKIIEQLNGDGDTVTDDNGNTIENAIVSDDPDYTNDIMKNIVFSGGGGSVTVQNLSGDAKATLIVSRVPHDVTGADCGVRLDLLITNTLTGATFVQNGGSVVNEAFGKNFNVRLEGVFFTDNMHRVNFHAWIYDKRTGEGIRFYDVGSISSIVDAEKFGTSDNQTAITQEQG